jgi:hypothetical protein
VRRRHIWHPTDWRLRLDPANVGRAEGWPERDLGPDTRPAEVPGVWNTTVPGYSGAAWYEARFARPFEPDGTVRLVVGGANYLTDAWLNGVYLGQHEGGYGAFSFRCGHALHAGENRLTLRIVDPPPDGEIDGLQLRECPTSKEAWYGGYGGPWGGVWLEQSARVWIEDVRVHGDLDNRRTHFRVTLATDLDQPADVRLQTTISRTDAAGRMAGSGVTAATVQPSGTAVAFSIRVARAEPWSPEWPELYAWDINVESADARAAGDWAGGTVGFRTVELRDGVLYLNGEPRYLKGALLQPTYPRSLILPPDQIVKRDIESAQSAGVNLLRCHLRPPPAPLLSLADAAGIMTYVEPPLAWIEPSQRLLEHGSCELASLVRACANHPSVVLWGIFNENARAAEAVGGDLLAELAALDPTRPIVENSGGAAVGEVDMWAWGGQSRCWSPGWESPRPLNDVHIYLASPLRTEARQILETVGEGPLLDVTPGRPARDRIESRLASDGVFVSEYGAGALPDFDAALAGFGDGRHLDDARLVAAFRDDLARGLAARGLDREIGDVAAVVTATQALQAESVLAQTAALRRNPHVTGYVLTQLADAGWEQMAGLAGLWRTPRPALAAYARANEPRLLWIEPTDPCSTGEAQLRAWLIQDPDLAPPTDIARMTVHAVTPTLSQRERGAEGGGHPVTLHTGATDLGTFQVALPAEPGRYLIRFSVAAGAWQDIATCTVLRLPAMPSTASDAIVLSFADGRPTTAALTQAIAQARNGAHLCLLGLDRAGAEQVGALLDLPLAVHGARGNFMGVYHYLRDHPLFAGLGGPALADGAFADVLPAWVLEEIPGATVLAGCFSMPDGGPGVLWRATVQTLAYGAGRLTFWQMQTGAQGGNLGDYLLRALLSWADSSRTAW